MSNGTVFIVAGNVREYHAWRRVEIPVGVTAHYVSRAEDLTGTRNPHMVMVGTWRMRPDADEIVAQIYQRSAQINMRFWKDGVSNINGFCSFLLGQCHFPYPTY